MDTMGEFFAEILFYNVCIVRGELWESKGDPRGKRQTLQLCSLFLDELCFVGLECEFRIKRFGTEVVIVIFFILF